MPAAKSRSPSLRPTTSLTRRPAEYIVSRIARSRRPMASLAGGGVEQPADLVGREEVRQRAALARIAQRLGRIRLGPAFALAEAEEAPQRGQPPGDRRLGVARLVQGRHVAAQIERS